MSSDAGLEVQVRSVGFENNIVRLKNNSIPSNIILEDDKAAGDRVLRYQIPDTGRSPAGNTKFEEPEPADGWTNYQTSLANNINVPEDLKTRSAKGQVELSFEVNQNGEPFNFKIEKSLCQKCDEEAMRVIK